MELILVLSVLFNIYFLIDKYGENIDDFLISNKKPDYFLDDNGKLHPWFKKNLKKIKRRFEEVYDQIHNNSNCSDLANDNFRNIVRIVESNSGVGSIYFGRGKCDSLLKICLGDSPHLREVCIETDGKISVERRANMTQEQVLKMLWVLYNLKPYKYMEELVG